MFYPTKTGVFTLLVIACLTIMVGCVIVPGINDVAKALKVPHGANWLITLPSLGVVLFAPLAGRCIDRLGAWHTLAAGLLLYGLLGAGAVFLQGMVMLFADRLLLGGATAMVMSAGTALIATFWQGEARLKMMAWQGMSIELGGVIFLAIGGVLAEQNWRWPFSLYLCAWLLLLMLWRWVPRVATANTAGEGENVPTLENHPAGLRLALFAACSAMIIFFTAIIMIPQHFHAAGISPAMTGYFLSFVSLVAVAAASQMPRLLQNLRDAQLLSVAFLCLATAHLLFAFATQPPLFIFGGVMLGCGFGFSIPLVNHMTVDYSSAPLRGKNLARLAMAIFSGQFLAAFMVYIPGDSSRVFSGAAVLSLLGLIGLMHWQRINKRAASDLR